MKRKFRGLDFSIYKIVDSYDYYTIIPTIEIRHKYWYLWYVDFCFLRRGIRIEICRKDWKDYDTEDNN